MTPLKLSALDADDLAVLSAHMQDALLKVGDLKYLRGERRFALAAERFNRLADSGERRHCAVHFERIVKVRSKRIKRGAADAILSLLAINFSPAAEPPSGTIELVFSGGGAIELDCECIEAALADLGPARATDAVPGHDLAGDD